MIDKRRPELKVLFRSQSTEFAEVMNQVRLIEVTGGETDIRPIHIRPALHGFDHAAEPVETVKLFRPQANFVPEQLNEVPLTVARLVGDLRR